jgi:hypothetical protein
MKTDIVYEYELPRVSVAHIENLEDLKELFRAIQHKELYVHYTPMYSRNNEDIIPSLHNLKLDENKGRITYTTYSSGYGDSVDERTYSFISIGSYVMWNQTKNAYVTHYEDGREFPTYAIPVALKANILIKK